MPTLKVAYIPEHFSTPLFFAQQQGYYKAHDLSIEFVKVPEGSGRLINLLNSNEVDIAIGLTEAFIADIAKGNENIHVLDTMSNHLYCGLSAPVPIVTMSPTQSN